MYDPMMWLKSVPNNTFSSIHDNVEPFIDREYYLRSLRWFGAGGATNDLAWPPAPGELKLGR